ncbi:MAG: peptide-methionine (S)-S-oxide reductase MsrA [Dehalococcoidia bacterium]|nr:MAG: peptide-methionine (S)-S-oxide reductase MsrA [Dehalococcoidia bacterium]
MNQESKEKTEDNTIEKATLAGGCFWCLEAIFSKINGIHQVVSGYTGGITNSPSYESVCTGNTGHAEAVQLTYDPQCISYKQILEIFFDIHDPTTLNRQEADIGSQYRSAIFYHNNEQREAAKEMIHKLDTAQKWRNPIVTEINPLKNFYPAEEYHHKYFERNPEQAYCRLVINPKLNKLREEHRSKMSRSSAC